MEDAPARRTLFADHLRAALLGAQHGRDRPYALGAAEVGMKGRPQRIAAPADAIELLRRGQAVKTVLSP